MLRFDTVAGLAYLPAAVEHFRARLRIAPFAPLTELAAVTAFAAFGRVHRRQDDLSSMKGCSLLRSDREPRRVGSGLLGADVPVNTHAPPPATDAPG